MIKTHDGEIYDSVQVLRYDLRRDIVLLKIRPFGQLPAVAFAATHDLTVAEDVAVSTVA